jgi:hypothetical protein
VSQIRRFALAEANFVLHAWLRSGNTGAGQGAMQFLSEALSLLSGKHRVRTLRADSPIAAAACCASS